MKKTLLLTIALVFSTVLFSQTFVDENFNSSNLPTDWHAADAGSDNWKISTTTYSGGDGNELMLACRPEFEGVARLVTKPYDLTGISELNVSFKHFYDHFNESNTIGIATSIDGITWNTGWSEQYNIMNVYKIDTVFTTVDMGKNGVMFCLFYEGNSHNMDNWFFDDLRIYKQSNLDIKINDINIPSIVVQGEQEISFTIENTGLTTIESFEAKIKASNWDNAIVASFEQNISKSEIVQVTCKDHTFNAIARNKPYTISVEILSINGENDQDATNNYIEKDINVAFNEAQRIPMIEHFSSSTCGPCVAVNQQMHTLTQNNEGKFTYTKFPTAGDPYNNFESTFRAQEYGVVGVPNIFLDGRSQGSTYITQEKLDENYNSPAYADIRGAFTMEGDNIRVIADFMSYIELNDVVAYITVNEKTTTKNTGSNGETEFHHIVMRMLKSKSGNPVSIKAGEYQRLEFTHNMSLTNAEELSDLEVALWLQDPETKEIYNSRFAYAYTSHCYPIQNLTLNKTEDAATLTWEAPENGTPLYYKVYVDGKLATEKETSLSYSIDSVGEIFSAEVIAVYENDKTSVGVAKLFGEIEEDPITIAAPRNLAAATTDTASINLTWDSVAYALSYNIYRDTILIKNTSETNYTDTGLEPGTEYCYTIASVFSDTISDPSDKACATTLTPEQPEEPEQPEQPEEPEQPGESIEELHTSVLFYPNPVEDKLYIETQTLTKTLTIEIYDIYGRRQKSIVNSQQSIVIDLSELKSGIYFVKINTEKGNIVKRIIKQ